MIFVSLRERFFSATINHQATTSASPPFQNQKAMFILMTNRYLTWLTGLIQFQNQLLAILLCHILLNPTGNGNICSGFTAGCLFMLTLIRFRVILHQSDPDFRSCHKIHWVLWYLLSGMNILLTRGISFIHGWHSKAGTRFLSRNWIMETNLLLFTLTMLKILL